MASLAGSTPASTFRALIKTAANAQVNGTLQQLSDGLGNGIPMAVSTTAVSMSNAVITGSLSGNATTATIAANILGGAQYYVPFFNTNTALSSSFLYQSASIFKTTYNGSDIGLNLDFANSIYKLGDYNGIVGTSYISVDSNNSEVNVIANNYTNLLATGNNVKIGDSLESNNGTMIEISDSSKIILTQFNSDQIGLNLDFENNLYELGKTNTGGVAVGLDVSNNTDYIDIGDYNNTNTGIGILVDVTNNLIKTYTSNPIAGTEKGLKLDFVNSTYKFGDLSSPSSGSITITNTRVDISKDTYITGSASITSVLTLPPQSPLPSGQPTGSFAVSGSGVNCKPYFWNGSTWVSMI